MPPAHNNGEVLRALATQKERVIHACGCDGLTTSVAAGIGVRAFDLTGSARAVARERFRFASASLARSSSIVAAAMRWAPAAFALAVGRAWAMLLLSASTP